MSALLIAAVIVFVLNSAGSFIEFNNRFVNALVDTVLFAVVFGSFCITAAKWRGCPGIRELIPKRFLASHLGELVLLMRTIFDEPTNCFPDTANAARRPRCVATGSRESVETTNWKAALQPENLALRS